MQAALHLPHPVLGGGLLPSPLPQPLRQRMRGTHMRPLLLFFSEIPCQGLAGPGGLSLEATSRKPSLSTLPRAVLPVWALPTTGRVTASTEGPGWRGRGSGKQVSSVPPGSARGSRVTTGTPEAPRRQRHPGPAPGGAPACTPTTVPADKYLPLTASSRGLRPPLSRAFTSSPLCSSMVTAPVWPARAAACSGV